MAEIVWLAEIWIGPTYAGLAWVGSVPSVVKKICPSAGKSGGGRITTSRAPVNVVPFGGENVGESPHVVPPLLLLLLWPPPLLLLLWPPLLLLLLWPPPLLLLLLWPPPLLLLLLWPPPLLLLALPLPDSTGAPPSSLPLSAIWPSQAQIKMPLINKPKSS